MLARVATAGRSTLRDSSFLCTVRPPPRGEQANSSEGCVATACAAGAACEDAGAAVRRCRASVMARGTEGRRRRAVWQCVARRIQPATREVVIVALMGPGVTGFEGVMAWCVGRASVHGRR